MKIITKIINLQQKYSTNQMTRLYFKLKPIILELIPKLKKQEKIILKKKNQDLNKLYKRTNILYLIRGICFLLLYISIVSAFVGDIYIIGEAIGILSVISGILGTAVLLFALSISQKLISINLIEAHLIADYIIALQVKYT